MTPELWRLIDQTRPSEPDPSAHALALTQGLVASGVEEVVSFAEAFDRAMDALYTWELWGAAYYALGGCGDDAFEYLRAWVVGDGERTWSMAMRDPEAVFLGLLGNSTDPDARWEEIRIHEGEALLYAAGTAHEELTGDWLSSRYAPHPSQPSGQEWDEALLAQLYPRLAAALREDWLSVSGSGSSRVALLVEVERGIASFADGDHVGAAEYLEPLIENPESWRLVPGDRIGDVAYAVGIGRLLSGDVEGSARALRMAGDAIQTQPHLRRALAQVEMANGELELAETHLDRSEGAEAWDRVLAAKLAWRKGNVEEALGRVAAELDRPTDLGDHPWDIAGRLQQVGQIFVEAGDRERAKRALKRIEPYLVDAPDELPLLSHVNLLNASVVRMHRPEQAVAALERCQSSTRELTAPSACGSWLGANGPSVTRMAPQPPTLPRSTRSTRRGSAGRRRSQPPKPASEPRAPFSRVQWRIPARSPREDVSSGALVERDKIPRRGSGVDLTRAEYAGVGVGGELTPLG